MKRSTAVKCVVVLVAFTAICVVAAVSAPAPEPGEEALLWYSIVPPLLAVTLALLTGRIFLSLGLSILVGGLLVSVPGEPASAGAWGHGLMAALDHVRTAVLGSPEPKKIISDWTHIQILAFVAFIMAMISVVIVAGGLHGIAGWLSRFARGPRSTQVVTAVAGLIVFIDDYVNTMIVGSTMRPMSDSHRISREKLSFLVDATSAPVAGIAIISTWIGYEVGLFDDLAKSLQIDRDGYSMFFDALPFRFYCFMMIGFVFVNALSGIDFGAMRRAEERARSTGEVAAADAQPMTSKAFSRLNPHPKAGMHPRIAVIPIVGLFAFFLGSLWIDGGGVALLSSRPTALLRLSGWREVMAASENSILLLAWAAALALVLAVGSALAFSTVGFREIGKAIPAGLRGSLLPLTILVLAWSLKVACDTLATGDYLVATVKGVLSPVWFPALLFLIAALTAFATGTSWGTMAILLPIAIPIAYRLDGDTYALTTMICLGAVLDGAICGDHCSPISDTTIMSSIASSCDHVHHVRTQIPYSVAVAVLAVVCGYLPAALHVPSWIGVLTAIGIMVAGFALLSTWRRRAANRLPNEGNSDE